MPLRRNNTHRTKATPCTTITQLPSVASSFCMVTTTMAPTTGPSSVPTPPISVIRSASAEVMK